MDDDLRVLMIEDDPAVAEMYRLKLAADGYAVEIAGDGETGIERARATQPDLIYLDIRLPTMDGFEVLEKLRGDARTAAIPVIILSNYGEAEMIERGHTLGALDFLVKSQTTPSDLSETAKKVSHRGELETA